MKATKIVRKAMRDTGVDSRSIYTNKLKTGRSVKADVSQFNENTRALIKIRVHGELVENGYSNFYIRLHTPTHFTSRAQPVSLIVSLLFEE